MNPMSVITENLKLFESTHESDQESQRIMDDFNRSAERIAEFIELLQDNIIEKIEKSWEQEIDSFVENLNEYMKSN